MREYARQRGLKRLMIPVPVLTPRLSSLWLGLVTPVYARVGRKLIDSIKHESMRDTAAALAAFPIAPVGCDEAIARALVNEDREFAETRWSDRRLFGERRARAAARSSARAWSTRARHAAMPAGSGLSRHRAHRRRERLVLRRPLWRLRGFLDLLVGGPGLRRGRRDPNRLRVGDALDFWRVEAVERRPLLRLGAEMKLPGPRLAAVRGRAGRTTRLHVRQTAIFDPVGLAGLAYWYGLFAIHDQIFQSMLRKIGHRAEVDAPNQLFHVKHRPRTQGKRRWTAPDFVPIS